MKKRNLWIVICVLALVLAALGHWAAQLQETPGPDTLQTQPTFPTESTSRPTTHPTTAATTVPTTTPTTAPTTVPTQPPLDTEAIIAQLSALTQDADPDLLRWILTLFGEDTLLALQDEFVAGYDRADWYTVTGNTYTVLTDVYSGAVDRDEDLHLVSMNVPGAVKKMATFVFGGDICLADNYLTMEHMHSSGHTIDTCIDPVLVQQMRAADLTFLNNEFTISDRGTPMAGKMYTFRSATVNTALYQTLGVDLVSLANNHAFDYGEEAFLDTLDTLKRHGIAHIGGGRNLQEAMQPQYYIVGGRKIAFVAATRAEKYIMTPAAGENSPGVLRCYDTALTVQAIQTAKANSDFVVACIHWGTEYSYTLEAAQTDSAREYIDAGADLIIGAHAHQLQGIEFYRGKAIFYNLGNFWFNSYEIETGLVKLEITPDGDASYTFLPALQKNCHTTSQIGTDRGAQILQTLRKYSINTVIDENGIVTPAKE